LKGEAVRPWAEATLITLPHPALRIIGSAAAVVWKAEDRLIAMIRSHWSVGKVSMGADVLDARVVHEDVAGARLCDERPAVVALGHVGRM
jgi:hypothetical protein